ncbi:hypothetical protein [Rhodococcus jostii]|uniref:hypothetical protein n=1 Tax=Rhodococcus jostii TaxID=132919 RepID=UPI00362E04CB
MRFARSIAIPLMTVAATVALGVSQVSAQTLPIPSPTDSAMSNVTQEEVDAIQSDLESSGVTPEKTVSSDGTMTVYDLATGTRIVTTEPPAPEVGSQSNIRIGFGTNIYYYFNQLEQQALANGAAATVVVAICAVSAGAACAVAAVAAGAATPYISEYGRCSNGRELEVAVSYLGSLQGVKCV